MTAELTDSQRSNIVHSDLKSLTDAGIIHAGRKQMPYYLIFEDRNSKLFILGVLKNSFKDLNAYSTPLRFQECDEHDVGSPFGTLLGKYNLNSSTLKKVKRRNWLKRTAQNLKLYMKVKGDSALYKEGRTLLNVRPYRWVKYHVAAGTSCAQTDILMQHGISVRKAPEYKEYPVEWLELNF